MRIEHTHEELLKAYEIVRQDIDSLAQMTSYYYSGDKDTLREAAENVLIEEGVPTELTHKEFVAYTEQFEDKIHTEFNRLVEYGKIECPKADSTSYYLKDRHEFLMSSEDRIRYEGLKINYDSLNDEDLPF